MKRLLVAPVLVLALAAPAAAAPGPPVKELFLKLERPQEKSRTHSCAKGGPNKQLKLPGFRATGDLAHKAVVACEQPPRSQPLVSGLTRAETLALLALVG